MNVTEIQVQRRDLKQTRVHTRALAPLAGGQILEDGEILVEVEKYALTANNVTYGVTGDFIGYWRFYPAADEWGIIPVWGFARVVESRAAGFVAGERMWGFLPMASHAVLRPSAVTATSFQDDTPHRRDLPSVYNSYQRTAGDAAALAAMEDERCLLFPLFTTAYLIRDWLEDNAYFGAKQVVIASVSSKTALGLANMLAHAPGRPVRVVGLTSPGNRDFVLGLGTCDQVLCYDEIAKIDASVPTAFVDMAGSATILKAVHEHVRENLVNSCQVGATHWNAKRHRGELPGATPAFFFAPMQIVKRDEEWGAGELLRRAFAESMRISAEMHGLVTITHTRGAEACRAAFDEMAAGQTPPSRGVMLSVGGN